MRPLIVVGFIAIVVILGVLSYIRAWKRREAMAAVAAKLGLRFAPAKNRDMARRYRFLDKLRKGSNRYAFNILSLLVVSLIDSPIVVAQGEVPSPVVFLARVSYL